MLFPWLIANNSFEAHVCRSAVSQNFAVDENMKKRRSFLVLILVIVAIASIGLFELGIPYLSRPTLVVLMNGKPAAHATILLPVSDGIPEKLDRHGSMQASSSLGNSMVMVSLPDGRAISFQIPRHGKKTVDICEDTLYVTTEQYFGFFKTEVEQIDVRDLKGN